MRTTILLMALALIPLLAPASTAQTTLDVLGSAAWMTDTTPDAVATDVGPGDSNQILGVTFQNNGTTALHNLYAQLGASSMVTPVDSASIPERSELAPGAKWTANLLVDISGNAQMGETYNLRVQLNAAEGQYTQTFPLTLLGHPDLKLGSGTTVLNPDAKTTLHIVVRNEGLATARGQSVTFSSRDLEVISPTGSETLNWLEQGKSQTFDVTVKAPDRVTTANLTAKLEYRGRNSELLQETETLRFTIGGTTASALKVGLKETQLNVGRTNTLHFTVRNEGDVDVTSIQVAAKLGAGTTVAALNASDTQTIEHLGPGESTPFTIQVLTSSEATGIFSFSVTAAGTNPDGAVSGSYNFAVALVGTIEFSLTGVTATLTSGGTSASIAGTFTNLGNAPAHNVYLSMTGSGFGSTQQQYLGDIDANAAFPFTATTTVTNSTLGQRPAGGGNFPSDGATGGFPGGTPPEGFPTGAPPDGFPTGAPPSDFPQGGPGQGGFGNRTGRGPGGFGPTLTFTLTWNDDYGALHTATYNSTASIRVAQAATTTEAPTEETLADRAIGLAQNPWAWGGLAAVIIAAWTIRAKVRGKKEF